MSSSSRQVDYTLVHPAPGHGKPLDWVPKEGDELYVGQPLPTALLQDSVTSVMFAGDDNVKKAFLPLLTTRELLMLRFMNAVTDKPEWQEKVTDDEIVARWRSETVPPNSVNEATMTDLMFDFCIAELRHKAKDVYSDPKTPIVVYNADVVKSDTAVPESVKIALQEAVKALEDVPSREKDWHPGSNEMVLDLVHPSLFPLIYGKSRVLKVGEKVVGREECIARCGEGEVLESGVTQKKANAKGGDDDNEGQDGEDEDEENDDSYYYRRRPDLNPYSSKFQWLPCEVDISGDDAKIISYINNLHPKHEKLYGLVEKVIDATLPLWEHTLAPLQSENGLQFFTRIICDGTEYEDDDEEENGEFGPSGSDGDHESSSEGESEGDEENKDKELTKSLLTTVKGKKDASEEEDEDAEGDDDEYEPEKTGENKGDENGGDEEDGEGGEEVDDDDDEEEEARVVIQPNPEPFAEDMFHLYKPLNFKELYGQKGRPLQVIVKLANIELTPEKPKYEGGTWHVEGKQNEHICATALYYYSSSNIKASHLAFKQFVETEFPEGFNYEQNDHGFLTEYFGLENEEAGVQYVGDVETKEGRLLTFPNILQHQVQPFELEDPTKSGHRKIVALFLVDPNVRVVSTAHVPAQQVDWWRESSETGKGTAATTTVVATGLSKLPVELKDQVFDSIEGFPITLREAKELREELMEERKRFVRDHAHAVKENNAFSLCEH